MFVAIRRYTTTGVNFDELKSSMDRDFLPKVAEISGFAAYYAVDSGANQIATVSAVLSGQSQPR